MKPCSRSIFTPPYSSPSADQQNKQPNAADLSELFKSIPNSLHEGPKTDLAGQCFSATLGLNQLIAELQRISEKNAELNKRFRKD